MIRFFFQSCLLLALSLSFVSLNTAVYNPNVHEQLHAHGKHDIADHASTEEESQDEDVRCNLCYIQNHIAASFTPGFKLTYNTSIQSEAVILDSHSLNFSEHFLALSTRAPPGVN